MPMRSALLEQELFDAKEGDRRRRSPSASTRAHDYRGAADLVRKLMFLEKLGEEIDAAYEALGQA